MKKLVTRRPKGFTLIELVTVVVVTAIIATGLVTIFVPTINFLFTFPKQMLAQRAGDELLKIIFEGDQFARGLRHTGPACVFPTGGVTTISAATSVALTYNYAENDHCYFGSGRNDHTVVLTYSAANQTVTRNINGAGAVTIPYYTQTAGELNFDEIENENVGAASLAFFRYWDSAGTEIDGSTPANIYRVDVAFRVMTKAGELKDMGSSVYMKSGCEIKRYTT